MAIAPLQIPQANINNTADFSPLANLGEIYKKAQNERKLSDLGQLLASGKIDYRAAAGQVADMGDINSTLKFLALSEQQRKEGLARQASADFMGSVFNPPAQAIAPVPSTRVNPAPGLVPSAAGDDEEPPARAAVASSPTVVGDAEGVARGLYPAAPTPATRPAGADQPLSFAQRFDAARPAGVAPAPIVPAPTAPVPAPTARPDETPTAQLRSMPQARSYVAAMLNPDLGEDQKKFAGEMLKRELDNAKPNERIQFLNDLATQSNYKGTPLELEMMLRKSGATNIDQRTEGAFAKTGGEVLAKRFGKISELGETASNDLQLIGQLRDLRQVVKTGGPAAVQGWLAERGVKVGKNVSEIEAYNSIINKLTPEQRVPGSGATSDYEDNLFKSALPRLINSPGGNEIIDQTLTSLSNHKIERARIAELALAGEISTKEAQKRFREMSDPRSASNPYAAFKAFGRAGFALPDAAEIEAEMRRRGTGP